MQKENEIARGTDNRAETHHRTENAPVRWMAPPVDVYENAEEFLVVADVPGTTEEDVSVELDRGELRVDARRNHGHTDGWRRIFTVPDGIDAGNVRAELKTGVLYVHLPKSPDVRPKKIKVSAAS